MPPNLGTMEDFTSVKGVFLHTKHLDSEMMVRCQQALLNNFPNINFTSVIADEKFFGYRVHFSSPSEEAVMAKKCLTVSGQDIRICYLTTYLTVHNINSNGVVQSDSDIRDAVNNRFGNVLRFVKIPGSPNHQNESINVFRVHIDVPEIKDLNIFDHEGLPEMCILLPDKKEKLKVTFFCRQCENDGHIRADCHQVIQRRASSAQERIISNDSGDVPKIPVMKIKILQEWTNTYAEKIGREEIMKTGILSEGNLNDNDSGPSTSTSETTESKEKNGTTFTPSLNIKKEEERVSHDETEDEIQTNENHNSTNVPKEEPSSTLRVNEDSNSNISLDDEIQVIAFRDCSNSANVSHTTPFKSVQRVGAVTSEDELNSPPRAKPAEYAFSSSHFSTPGPSNAITGSTRPSISVEVTSYLSDRLQECINRACEAIGVLSRKKLEAFLTHVKKKSNPIRVASNYTPYPLKLKQLLQLILDYYYDTPQTGTKEDIQFIKWLNGLVGRFEGTVSRKRKRGGLNHDEPPTKK